MKGLVSGNNWHLVVVVKMIARLAIRSSLNLKLFGRRRFCAPSPKTEKSLEKVAKKAAEKGEAKGNSFFDRLFSFLAGCGAGFGASMYFLRGELDSSTKVVSDDLAALRSRVEEIASGKQ